MFSKSHPLAVAWGRHNVTDTFFPASHFSGLFSKFPNRPRRPFSDQDLVRRNLESRSVLKFAHPPITCHELSRYGRASVFLEQQSVVHGHREDSFLDHEIPAAFGQWPLDLTRACHLS